VIAKSLGRPAWNWGSVPAAGGGTGTWRWASAALPRPRGSGSGRPPLWNAATYACRRSGADGGAIGVCVTGWASSLPRWRGKHSPGHPEYLCLPQRGSCGFLTLPLLRPTRGRAITGQAVQRQRSRFIWCCRAGLTLWVVGSGQSISSSTYALRFNLRPGRCRDTRFTRTSSAPAARRAYLFSVETRGGWCAPRLLPNSRCLPVLHDHRHHRGPSLIGGGAVELRSPNSWPASLSATGSAIGQRD